MVFSRVLYAIEDACDWAWRGPEWARPAVGGVLLGGLLLVLPEMYGVGYPVLQAGVAGRYALGFLLVLLVGKLLATSLTLAIGGSGGIFAPSLFLGAMTGTALGLGFAALAPGVAGPAGAYGLVGMAAVLAGATRAPITAVVIVAEITGEWSLIVPLMIAVALATALSRLVSRETIYTMKLSRRGIRLTPPGAREWRPFGPGEVLELPEGRCLVRLPVPDDGWSAPPAFARLDGGADDARVLLTGPADDLDALAATLRRDDAR